MPALELGGLTLGAREGVIALIVLVTIYMVFVLLRMLYLAQQACRCSRAGGFVA